MKFFTRHYPKQWWRHMRLFVQLGPVRLNLLHYSDDFQLGGYVSFNWSYAFVVLVLASLTLEVNLDWGWRPGRGY